MIKNNTQTKSLIDFKTVYTLYLGLEFKKTLVQHYCLNFDYSPQAFRQRMNAKKFSPAEKDFLYSQLKSNAAHITKKFSFEQLFDNGMQLNEGEQLIK